MRTPKNKPKAAPKGGAPKRAVPKRAVPKGVASKGGSSKGVADASIANASVELRDFQKAARILTDAVPYLRGYAGKPIVVKLSGHIADDDSLLADFARDLALARQVGARPVVVHGGAPQIAAQLAREGLTTEVRNGLRVTDRETARVVEMVLAGSVNKRVVQAIEDAGGRAVGLSGRDGSLISAKRHRGDKALGQVGTIEAVRIQPLLAVEQGGMIPVVAPVAGGERGETLNINADTAAGAIAAALGAVRLLIATDVEGLLDADGRLVRELTLAQARACLRAPSVGGGMVPKLETCIRAVEAGVEAAVILDGRVPHSLLLELFTSLGAGTRIRSAPLSRASASTSARTSPRTSARISPKGTPKRPRIS